jgi:exonuclease III
MGLKFKKESTTVSISRIIMDVEDFSLDSSFRIINIYGPYTDKRPFLEGLSNYGILQAPNVVIGGDLNFTLSLKEVWGKHPKRDLLEGFFSHWISAHNLVDLESPKISQTWTNGRKGGDLVAKRMDSFLVAENMSTNLWIIKSSMTIGGNSDHMPILLNISKGVSKPLTPLKFNHD